MKHIFAIFCPFPLIPFGTLSHVCSFVLLLTLLSSFTLNGRCYFNTHTSVSPLQRDAINNTDITSRDHVEPRAMIFSTPIHTQATAFFCAAPPAVLYLALRALTHTTSPLARPTAARNLQHSTLFTTLLECNENPISSHSSRREHSPPRWPPSIDAVCLFSRHLAALAGLLRFLTC